MEKRNRQHLENEIHEAFKNVRLEDGIGYFEAMAKDDYVQSSDAQYAKYKALDLRNDWNRMVHYFETSRKDDSGNPSLYHFMDEKGLRYYLPVFMVHKPMNAIIDRMIILGLKEKLEYGAPAAAQLCFLRNLSAQQKQCLLSFYHMRHEEAIAKAEEPYLCKCGQWHIPWQKAECNSAEAYAVEMYEEAKVFVWLKKYFEEDKNHFTINENEQWTLLQNEIYKVFKKVKLEDGIGYYEASIIDDGFTPAHREYTAAKAKDERDDWRKMLSLFANREVGEYHHFYMDAKGLYFYVPFLMIRREPILTQIICRALLDIKYPENKKQDLRLIDLLTNEQKKCIYRFYQFMIQTWWWEDELLEDYVPDQEKMRDLNFMAFLKEQFDKD